MIVLELLLRGMTAGAVLTTAIAFLRTSRRGAARWGGVLFSISVAAFAMNSGGPETQATGWLYGLIWLFSAAGTAYFWMFAVALFDDRPMSPVLLAPPAVMTLVGLVGAALPGAASEGVWIVHNLLEVVLVAHVVLVIWKSWRGDLVEARRSLRVPFTLVVAVYCVVLSGMEIAWSLGYRPAWGGFVQAASLLALSLAGAAAFLNARPELFEGPARPAPDAVAAEAIPAQDRPTLARLRTLMAGDDIWRREGLTVGQLAAEVGVPEHRLRRLINGGLGFRNFADFLNARRIEAARAVLSDPAHARTPVSSLAFDLGYASLGPFNRAFKEATGLTPTAWRARALDASPGS